MRRPPSDSRPRTRRRCCSRRSSKSGPVVPAGEPLLSDGHPHAGGDALPERSGRGFDARDPVILGMSRAPCCRAGENGGYRRGTPRAAPAARSRRSPPGSPSGAARTRAASRRDRSRARTDRGWARSDPPDRSASRGSRSCRPAARAPSACRGARTWLAAPHRSRACESC